LLVLAGAALYGCSNTAQEHLIDSYSSEEFLAALGMGGTLLSAVQVALLEREALAQFLSGATAAQVGNLAGFVGTMFILYGGVPLLIRRSSATVMNLSFLTSDFWSLLSARFLFNTPLTMYYFVSFAVIVLGLAIYHMAGGPTVELAENAEKGPDEEESGAAAEKPEEVDGSNCRDERLHSVGVE
jgi:solute carrier family 35 protein F1/2